MQIVPCSLILWHMIAAALAVTDFFSENEVDSLNAEDSNWLLEDGNLDLNPGAGSSSKLFLSDDSGLPSFKELNLNSSPDMLDWNLQPEPGSVSFVPNADLTTLSSLTDPISLLQDSIWDEINSPVAENHIGCEVSLADDIALSVRRRRETKCKSPDIGNPSNDRGPNPYNPSPIPWTQHNNPLNYAFSEEFEICTKRIFKDANFPVCKEESPPADQIYTEPEVLWAHLYDVSPIVLYSAPSLCPSGQVVWCCELIQRRAKMRPDNYDPPIIVHYPLPQVANLIRGSLKWFYDGYTCYRHAQWYNGPLSVDAFGPINRNY